jgi:DNA mismatch repair protein MutL
MREEGPAADGTKPAPTAMRETETASPSPKPEQAPAQQPMGPLAARPAEKAEQTESFTKNEPKPIKVFGALFDTYILIEYADQLLLVDQHAVHERLLFDKMMKEFVDHGTVASQEMLVPRIIPVTRQEQDAIEENREMLESIGLSLETFGEHDLAIRAVPMVLGAPESVDFVREVIEELENGKDPGFERKRAMILQTACKHAVKGGERLTEEILRDLVEQMLEKKVTPTCPHGRPLVVSISHRELDRKFKRIQ